MSAHVLGVDPGLASLGMARVRLLAVGELVEELRVVRTEPSTRKRKVRAADDNVERLRVLLDALIVASQDVVAICSEAQSWPRNAASAIKVGMVWGLLVAVADLRHVPILQVSPQQLKRTVAGSRSASKEQVQTALERRYPELPDWPAYREHAADALGAVVACLDDGVILMGRRLA